MIVGREDLGRQDRDAADGERARDRARARRADRASRRAARTRPGHAGRRAAVRTSLAPRCGAIAWKCRAAWAGSIDRKYPRGIRSTNRSTSASGSPASERPHRLGSLREPRRELLAHRAALEHVRTLATSSRTSVWRHGVHAAGPVAAASATARTDSAASRSSVPTVAATSRTRFSSERSRRVAVSGSSRCSPTMNAASSAVAGRQRHRVQLLTSDRRADRHMIAVADLADVVQERAEQHGVAVRRSRAPCRPPADRGSDRRASSAAAAAARRSGVRRP